MFLPESYTGNSKLLYFNRFAKRNHIIYLLIILAVTITIAILPLVSTDVSVNVSGIIRPIDERTEIKSVIGGIIDTLFYKEGDSIKKGETILRLKDDVSNNKRTTNNFEINQRQEFIHDLKLLTTEYSSANVLPKLKSSLYKEQAIKFFHQRDNQAASLAKANKELEMNASLVKDKVISPKEFFDVEINQRRTSSGYQAFIKEQLSTWQKELASYSQELIQYRQELEKVNTDATYYEVKAPMSGTIQGINTRYAGSLLQANEVFCTISPTGNIIAECYPSSKDIGLIRLNQPVKFQIDAALILNSYT